MSRTYRNQWTVESMTDPGKVYKVSEDFDGSWACSCPAWIFSGRKTGGRTNCKHITAVITNMRPAAPPPTVAPPAARPAAKAPARRPAPMPAGEEFIIRQAKSLDAGDSFGVDARSTLPRRKEL